MKLLWLCNMAPGAVKGNKSSGLWIDSVLSGLQQENVELRILFPGRRKKQGTIGPKCSFASFKTAAPYKYLEEVEAFFTQELANFQPDVIHVWGTEYAHTLAMMNAAEMAGLQERVVVHIQGLCSVIARHYAEGIPHGVQNRNTFRDFLRKDNIAQQQKKFARRGELEVQALRKARHVIGRTDWDEACVNRINPDAVYHFGNETLRSDFYDGRWQYGDCRKHRIFASCYDYPVKGFHYLLEAFGEVLKYYPDATLAVPGKPIRPSGWMQKLRRSSYQKYLLSLIQKYGLEDKVEFLGSLSADQMKAQYLSANVFVLPSTIENSPNSLGEAMLLGVPCVAADVGGVSTMLNHRTEGWIYQGTAPYMLAHYVMDVFAMEDRAEAMGAEAAQHAANTHDPEKNMARLLEIYQELAR